MRRSMATCVRSTALPKRSRSFAADASATYAADPAVNSSDTVSTMKGMTGGLLRAGEGAGSDADVVTASLTQAMKVHHFHQRSTAIWPGVLTCPLGRIRIAPCERKPVPRTIDHPALGP